VGHLAAAFCKSPPVFCGRRGILTTGSQPEVFGATQGTFRNCRFGARMKTKNRKKRKRRPSARHEERSVEAKKRASIQKKNAGYAPPPWLRILSTAAEFE
jgi:hypothetical protein